MKKISLLMMVVAFGLTLGLISCGGGGNQPSAVVEKGMNAFYGEDFETVVDLYAKKDGTKLTEEERSKLLGMMPMALKEQMKKEGLDNIEILEETITEEGDRAKVKYKVVFKNGDEDTETVKLINIDGDWYMLLN